MNTAGFLALTLAILPLVGAAPAPSAPFHYDAVHGRCVDAAGAPGLNRADAATLLPGEPALNREYADVDTTCTDFRDFNFNLYAGTGGAKLTRWNLAGADLTGARLFFVRVQSADLRGAKLKNMQFGYTTIAGVADKNTTFPRDACVLSATALKCER